MRNQENVGVKLREQSLFVLREIITSLLDFFFSGHNLDPEHRLDDGGLRYATNNLIYSMNKKKRWLLPDIIEQRLCEYDPSDAASKSKKNDPVLNVDERLKIVMFENENVDYTSNCLRYGNSQTNPHIIHKNGRRFNLTTLTKWMNFDTRSEWNRRRRRPDENNDHVNQPNFGIEQRPGFFPSEVTYEFLYPRRVPASEDHRGGKTSLRYAASPRDGDWHGRHYKDTNRNRRFLGRIECNRLDQNELDFDFEEMVDEHQLITAILPLLDENDRWTVVFEEAGTFTVIIWMKMLCDHFRGRTCLEWQLSHWLFHSITRLWWSNFSPIWSDILRRNLRSQSS